MTPSTGRTSTNVRRKGTPTLAPLPADRTPGRLTDMLLSAFDKARTLELAGACGVRIPPTRVPASLAECHAAAAAVGYPCILKPRFSDFWDGERFVADHGPQYVPDAAALEATALATRQGDLWPVVQGLVGAGGVAGLRPRGGGPGRGALVRRRPPPARAGQPSPLRHEVAWAGHGRVPRRRRG